MSTLIAIVLGCVAGVLSGTFGVGGAVIFIPTLAFLLGLSQLSAQATSLAAMLPAVLIGAWQQARKGNVHGPTAVTVGLFSVIGVVAGTLVAEELSAGVLRRLFGCFLVLVAFRLGVAAIIRGRGGAYASGGSLLGVSADRCGRRGLSNFLGRRALAEFEDLSNCEEGASGFSVAQRRPSNPTNWNAACS